MIEITSTNYNLYISYGSRTAIIILIIANPVNDRRYCGKYQFMQANEQCRAGTVFLPCKEVLFFIRSKSFFKKRNKRNKHKHSDYACNKEHH